MKILTLNIPQEFFDDIIAGIAKYEAREIRAKIARKYVCHIDNKGVIYENDTDVPEGVQTEVVPIKYDAIQLYAGCKTEKDSALIRVEKSEIIFMLDDNGEPIQYVHEGREYLETAIVYHLGDIIEKAILKR